MNTKKRERIEAIQQKITKIEAWRPRAENVDVDIVHYEYSRIWSAVVYARRVCLAVIFGTFTSVIISLIFAGPTITVDVRVFLAWLATFASALVFYAVTTSVMDHKGISYVTASERSLRYLENERFRYVSKIMKREQKMRNAEVYRERFERLKPYIVQELKVPFHERDEFSLTVEFGWYDDEWLTYELNEAGYVDLLLRIAGACYMYDSKNKEVIERFIHDFEDSLKL